MQQHGLPGDNSPPIMAHQNGRFLPQRIQNPDQVSGRVYHIIIVNIGWGFRFTKASHVRSYDPIAGIG